MVGTPGAGIVAADRCDRGTVGKINRSALHLGFALQLGVVLDNAFHGLEHAGKGLLQVIGISFGASCVNPHAKVKAPLSVVLPDFLMQLYRIVSQAAGHPDRRQRRVSTLRVDGR